MELDAESRHVPSHVARSTLFLAAMRHFASDLAGRGIPLRYVCLDDPDNSHSFESEVVRALRELEAREVSVVLPGEWRVLRALERAAADAEVPLEVLPDSHFYCTPEEFTEWAEGRKSLVLEHFYRWQRKRFDILMDGPEPEGGRWNFDAENRQAFKEAPEPPRPYMPREDAVRQEVRGLVASRLAELPGRAEGRRWPITPAQAKRALDDFIEHRLPSFGTYQDAMWEGEPFLYHSLLSPSLNIKLLDPRECVARALEAYYEGHAPLAAVEGFVRQIVGWREFIRGVYWNEGEDYAARNELGAAGCLPSFYWDGETEMACMADAIGQVLEHGYGHHIQRLMVTGNFALVAGISPREVSDWYLGMYVDAVDWVTLPNTLGMVMHADGGVVGTKPYAASGRYIERMGNHCGSCRYDPGKRHGEDACPFTVFYWDFLLRHETRFEDNRRMVMMYRHVEKMSREEKALIRKSASRLRRDFGIEERS
jgi:deoxyribodipyrimidine photolyase-related protein